MLESFFFVRKIKKILDLSVLKTKKFRISFEKLSDYF
mgnify:FL=1